MLLIGQYFKVANINKIEKKSTENCKIEQRMYKMDFESGDVVVQIAKKKQWTWIIIFMVNWIPVQKFLF